MLRLMMISFCLSLCIFSAQAQKTKTVELWPAQVPDEKEAKIKPQFVVGNDKVTRIKKVTNPTLTIYRPDKKVHNGAAMIICPGGGYHILAIDKEGSEVAEHFTKLGYTCFVLQYRVPSRQKGALQDAQRAMRYVRARSSKLGIESNKIGILGFSAGGHLSASISTRYMENHYEPIDKADSVSARPDFSVLIYPAYLDRGPGKTLSRDIKVDQQTPPMFMAVSSNDIYANSSLAMSSALLAQKLPVELHVFPTGGHGFGLRKGKYAAETWPKLCAKWLETTVLKK